MKKQIKKALFLLALFVCVCSLAACMLQTAHTCVDRNGDSRCDTCSQPVAPTVCTVHIDNNGDGLCDRAGCGAAVLKEMFDVTFNNLSKTYSGKEYTIEVEDAPEGAEITYNIPNTQVNAGKYTITATVRAEGYQDTELTATLTIKPKNIAIKWGEFAESYPANGKAPELPYTLSGLVEGDEVEVELDFGKYNFKEPKTVIATAVSKNPNYNIKTNKITEVIMGENVHTITFDTGLNNITLDSEVVLDGTAVDEPKALTKFGHVFIGWYNGEEKWDFTSPVTEPMNLVAKWQLSEYRIDYVTNGGVNPDGAPERFTIETTDSLPVPQKENSIFLGWFVDSKLEKAANRLGSEAKNITLYAKWSDNNFVEIEQGKKIDSESNAITLSSSAVNGSFYYVFSATVKDFADENGVIRIGRGKNTLDGSYIELTKNKLTVYTNTSTGGDVVEDSSNHVLRYDGFIIVEISVTGNTAGITLRTATGASNFTKNWTGRNGEIFFDSENVTLENASFGWMTEMYKELVWIVGDEDVGSLDNETSLTHQLTAEQYSKYLAIGAKGLNSRGALDVFKSSYEKALSNFAATPKYAIWSFRADKSETYDADVDEFVSFCTEKGIIPVLTTQHSTADFDNTVRNNEVKTSGVRYIDFASLNENSVLDENKNYTEVGAKEVFAKFMVDFPEIVAAAATMRTETAASIQPVSSALLYPEGYDIKADAANYYRQLKGHRENTASEVLGSALTMKGNSIKNGKYMIFSAKISGTLGEKQTILLGQGYMQSTGKWIEINGKEVLMTGYQSWGDQRMNPVMIETHGLEIKNYITVIITCDVVHSQKIHIYTDGGYFSPKYYKVNGNTGDFFAAGAEVELNDASLSWTCADYAKDIWVFGDSYLSMGDPARWPTYLWDNEKYYNALMDGKSGMNSDEGIADLEDALQYGTPKYVVWLEGMNDNEDGGKENQIYKDSIKRLFELSEEKKFTPVIATIPNCYGGGKDPRRHEIKNNCIRRGIDEFEGKVYRIIDWANAVEDLEHETHWYEGMLNSADYVHPAVLGAKALYMQLATDFPEIFGGWNGEIDEEDNWAKADTLVSGGTLTVEAPETFKNNKIFTFSAEFTGYFAGTIEIGNGKNVEGGTWVSISSSTVTVYQYINGETVVIRSIDNKLKMNNLFRIKIHVKDDTASIVMASTGEKEDLGALLFGFGDGQTTDTTKIGYTNSPPVSWTAVGDAFVTVNGTNLERAKLCWYTAD